jgi:hypothetical protein
VSNWREMPERSGVYALKLGDRVMYVGSSLNIRHRCESYAFCAYRCEVLELCSPDRLREREQWHMDLLKPPLNRSRATRGERLAITLTPPVARRVEQMARDEQRPVAAMMRLLVERALEQTEVSR